MSVHQSEDFHGSEPSLRVCIISHAYVEPGFQPVLRAIALQPGIELTLITPLHFKLGAYTSNGDFSTNDTEYGYHTVPIRWGERQGAFHYHQRELDRALSAARPEIILHEQEVFAIGAGQIAALAAARTVPLVMFVWENIDRVLSLPRIWLRSYVLAHCAGLMVGSVRSGEVHRDWGFKGPIEVIPQMGVKTLNPSPVYGRRGGPRLELCYAGRVTAYKGLDCLLRAIALLRNKGISVRCTLAGRGEQLAELQTLATALELGESIVFVGVLQPAQVAELFRRSDVLVLPSRRTKTWEEQFGRVLVEAMAEATLTVGSRTGAIAEVIGDDELLFDEDDVAGLAAILERLASDDVFFVNKQQKLWDRARTTYTNEVLARRKVAFLREVLGVAGSC